MTLPGDRMMLCVASVKVPSPAFLPLEAARVVMLTLPPLTKAEPIRVSCVAPLSLTHRPEVSSTAWGPTTRAGTGGVCGSLMA